MKKITMFYLDDCGYCHKAHKALEELYAENPDYEKIEIHAVEESKEPEFADKFDYYATPTFYVDDQKVFEAHIGMTYEQIKKEVKNVLDTAINN
ncbi:glutaredoxin family protein [Eggerthia catenaformis]|uniref:glutaredoxin family protein n=1 Tax=Eggerthia catenaformis TaxID=31973 RepID=UPI00248E0688|nr:glutaredoxin [Eggerthia catenaformis]